MIRLKRVYDSVPDEDGFRILVDGLVAGGYLVKAPRLIYF